MSNDSDLNTAYLNLIKQLNLFATKCIFLMRNGEDMLLDEKSINAVEPITDFYTELNKLYAGKESADINKIQAVSRLIKHIDDVLTPACKGDLKNKTHLEDLKNILEAWKIKYPQDYAVLAQHSGKVKTFMAEVRSKDAEPVKTKTIKLIDRYSNPSQKHDLDLRIKK